MGLCLTFRPSVSRTFSAYQAGNKLHSEVYIDGAGMLYHDVADLLHAGLQIITPNHIDRALDSMCCGGGYEVAKAEEKARQTARVLHLHGPGYLHPVFNPWVVL